MLNGSYFCNSYAMAEVWPMYRKCMHRVVIYPKDIMIITGKSERYSRYLIQRIKKHLNKEDHQLVSITEFCNYMGLEREEVDNCIH